MMKSAVGSILALLIFSSCATVTPIAKNKYSAQELFQYACKPGSGIRTVDGTVWLKASSTEFTGQFPANVNAISSQQQLKLEITNLLGGTEAAIQVDHDHYEVTQTRRENDRRSGKGTWGSIPLRWATDLFIGKIPCPAPSETLKMTENDDGQLVVQVPANLSDEAQEFVYTFKDHDGLPWPVALHWSKSISAQDASRAGVDFKFDEVESGTLSPKKWEARSSKGSIKIRWRSRNVTN